jgi:ketosteroid isomerase-like protein
LTLEARTPARKETFTVIDEARAQQWLDAYTHAWESYDPAAIGDLFTEDAEYRWHPWDADDKVARGRQAIVAAWLDNRDAPGTYTGAYRPLLVHDQTTVAVGVSRYYSDSSRRTLDTEFHNLWIIDFDDSGRCKSFTEWFMRSPKQARRS